MTSIAMLQKLSVKGITSVIVGAVPQQGSKCSIKKSSSNSASRRAEAFQKDMDDFRAINGTQEEPGHRL